MNSIKLLAVLASLRQDEWNRLRKFILQYSKESSDVVKVFDYFYTYSHRINEIKITDVLVQKYFPHLTKKVFLNYLSTLYYYVEQWLVLNQVESEKHSFDLYLVKAFNQRGLYHLANQNHTKILKSIEKDDTYSLSNSKAKAMLYEEQYYSNNPIKYDEGAKILSDLLEAYFNKIMSHLILYESEMHNWGKIQNYSYKKETEIINQLKEIIPSSELSIALDDVVKMLTSDDVEIYLRMVERVLNEKFEKGNLQTIVTIYTLRKSNELWSKKVKVPNQIKLIEKLYDFAMTHGVYTDHGKISSPSYRNLIMALSFSQPFQKLKEFNEKWIHKVNSSHPESTKSLSEAIICFYHEKYEKIFVLTRNTEYDDVNEKAYAHSLHLIACFMNRKNEYDLYQNSLTNFESFLLRNKKSFSIKFYKGLRNVCQFMKQYDKTKNKVDLSQFDFLQFRIWMEKMNDKRK